MSSVMVLSPKSVRRWRIGSLFHPIPVAHVSQVQGDWHYAVGPLLGEGNRPFKGPKLLALTPDGAFLIVADIVRLTIASDTDRLVVLRATDGAWVRQLTCPRDCSGLAVTSTGEILVSDWINCRVVCLRSVDDDAIVGTLGSGRGSGPTEFDRPGGLTVLEGARSHPIVRILYVNDILH